jgi:hypothetical protein
LGILAIAGKPPQNTEHPVTVTVTDAGNSIQSGRRGHVHGQQHERDRGEDTGTSLTAGSSPLRGDQEEAGSLSPVDHSVV